MNGQQSGYGNGLFVGRHNGRHGGLFAGGKRDLFAKQSAVAPPSEWDADFLAFWERTSGTMNDDWKASYNQLVKDLKAAGIWDKADIIYCFASANEADARLNLKSASFGATAYNSPTFTAKSGFKFNGASNYLATNYAPSINGNNFAINSAYIGTLIYAANTIGGNVYLGGAFTAASGGGDAIFMSSTTASSDAVNSGVVSGLASYNGWRSNNRTSSTNLRRLNNGSRTNIASSSSSLTNKHIYIGCLSRDNTPLYFSNAGMSFYLLASSISDAEEDEEIIAVNNFLDSIADI